MTLHAVPDNEETWGRLRSMAAHPSMFTTRPELVLVKNPQSDSPTVDTANTGGDTPNEEPS